MAKARMMKHTKNGSLVAAPIAASLLSVFSFLPSVAYGQSTSNWVSDWMNQPTMTGDWGGERTSLAQEGVSFTGQLQSQWADVPVGGREQGDDYDQQAILGADFNLQKLLGLNGALFHLYISDRAGRNIASDKVGSTIQPLNDFGSGENFRLSIMSYEQNLFNKRVNILVGFYPDGTEFVNSGAVLCAFVSNGLCSHPNSLGHDTSGQSNFPGAQWGGRVKFFVTPSLYESVGVFDVNPQLTSGDNQGFNLSLNHSTGAIIYNEIGKTTHLGADNLVGHYKIGGYYDTSTVAGTANAKELYTGRYGGYLLMDQMIYSFQPNTPRGIIAFFDATVNDKRTSAEQSYFDAGLILKGFLASRPVDTLALGWIKNNANSNAIKAFMKAHPADDTLFTAEQVIELDYNYQVSPWFSVHPTVQYWINPGAITANSAKEFPNAWLYGVQTTINF